MQSQIVTNGNFSSGASSWGCSPETNPESVYGGSGSNTVAEVDAAASLCQTLTGLGIGNIYSLSFVCSRRTGGCPSPNPTNINIAISGGALSSSVTRTNTTFGLTMTSFNFTATSTSHVLNFSGGSGFGGSTCGMIIDDISITLVSALPIELLFFKANLLNNQLVTFSWETASELNNDFFTVERSSNSIDWESIGKIKGAGNSTIKLSYNFRDTNPLDEISYYRLKQTDFDGNFNYSSIQYVDRQRKELITIYPNPSKTHRIKINSNKEAIYTLNLYNSFGEIHTIHSFKYSTDELDLSSLPSGVYYLTMIENTNLVYHTKLILE